MGIIAKQPESREGYHQDGYLPTRVSEHTAGVPVTIEWRNSWGNNVQLTGSFWGWGVSKGLRAQSEAREIDTDNFEPRPKSERRIVEMYHGNSELSDLANSVEMQTESSLFDDQIRAIELSLLPGLYEFKFVVDGKWTESAQYPTVGTYIGQHVRNNYIIVEGVDSDNVSIGAPEDPIMKTWAAVVKSERKSTSVDDPLDHAVVFHAETGGSELDNDTAVLKDNQIPDFEADVKRQDSEDPAGYLALQAECQKLKHQLQEMKAQVKRSENSKLELEATLRVKNQELAEKCQSLETESRQEFDVQEARCVELQEECEQLKSQMQALRQQVTDAENTKDELESSLHVKNQQLVEKCQLLETESRKEFDVQEARCVELRKECEQLKSQMQALRQQVTDTENDGQRKLETIRQERDTLIEKYQSFEVQMKMKETETAHPESPSSEKELIAERARCVELQEECEQLKSQMQALRQQVTDAENDGQRKLETIRQEHDTLIEKYQSLEIQMKTKETETAHSDSRSSQKEVIAEEARCVELQEECEQLKSQMQALRQQVTDAENDGQRKLETIRQERDTLIEKYQSLELHMKMIQTESTHHESQSSDKEEIHEKVEVIPQHGKQSASLEHKITRLNEELEREKKTGRELSSEMVKLRRMVKVGQDDIRELQRHIRQLTDELKEFQKNRVLPGDVATLKSQLAKRLEQLEHELMVNKTLTSQLRSFGSTLEQ